MSPTPPKKGSWNFKSFPQKLRKFCTMKSTMELACFTTVNLASRLMKTLHDEAMLKEKRTSELFFGRAVVCVRLSLSTLARNTKNIFSRQGKAIQTGRVSVGRAKLSVCGRKFFQSVQLWRIEQSLGVATKEKSL